MKKEKRLDSRNKIPLLAAVVLVAVAAFAVFGVNGLLDVYKKRKERDGILAYNTSIEAENKGLEEQIALLKTDKRYIGRIARKELGMLGKNEMIYRFEEVKK